MDTTITISSKRVPNKSDFLHLTYNAGKNKDAIISVDSSNFGQSGSVSWDKKGSTLSNIEKVTNWMKQSDKECVKTDFTEIVKNNEPESKSLILLRCDFNKSTNSQPYYQSPFNRSTSLINYFKDEKVTLSNTSKVPLSPKLDAAARHTEKKVQNSFHSPKEILYSPTSKTESSLSTENKSENTDEVPLSPESRKKELCHYLQLMNPADKKEILILQNRRSSRVKNLAEQKQYQEKLKVLNDSTHTEKDIDSSEKSATLKSFKELNIQILPCDVKDESDNVSFPCPPQHLHTLTNDFDDVMERLIPKLKKACRNKNILYLTKSQKAIKDFTRFSIKSKQNKLVKNLQKRPKRRNIKERIKTLRSNGSLKDVPIKNLIEKNEKRIKGSFSKYRSRKSVTPTSVRSRKKSPAKSVSSHCEIISVGHLEDEDTDLNHSMDDMVNFDKLSEENKKCLIESRILTPKSSHIVPNSEKLSESFNLQMSPLYGFSKSDGHEISKMCEKYKNSMEVGNQQEKDSEIEIKDYSAVSDLDKLDKNKAKEQLGGGNTFLIVNIHTPDTSENASASSEISEHSSSSSLQEHDYAGSQSEKNEKDSNDSEDIDVVTLPTETVHPRGYMEVNTKTISSPKYELLPYKTTEGTKSLHKSLQFSTKKKQSLTVNAHLAQEWDIQSSPKQHLKKQSHFISISSENGAVLKAFYVDYNLILCQEFLISFWMQTPLGNVLGSQNMWIPRGQTQRIVLNNRCLQKDSTEKVICLETSTVYIELWMKEHKSEMRQGPVADVFITLYYWKQRQNGLDKKVLQLENINGFADDVQYCVMKNFPKIIVSWHTACEESTTSKKTFIHAYQLAADYQTIENIFNIEPVGHYVSSLHNIEDFDDLIMGCGENKITLWNIEFGHIIATVEFNDIKTPLSTLWVKCDRGFLFALQQCVDRELRLIAINGINHSWKKLASYNPPEGFDRLKGVCIENGLLLSFYDQGILCWNAETGEPIEEINVDSDVIPSGAHVILVEDNQIIVKHAFTHLMAISVEES